MARRNKGGGTTRRTGLAAGHPFAYKTCLGTGEFPKAEAGPQGRVACHKCGKPVAVRNLVLVWHTPPKADRCTQP